MAASSSKPTGEVVAANPLAEEVKEMESPEEEEEEEEEPEEEEEEEPEEQEEEEEEEAEAEEDAEALNEESPADAPAKVVAAVAEVDESDKWPGWPGDNVFRMVVPVSKVGGIIGKKGDLIKKLCEETRAKIRILDGVVGTTDRIVLISAKEEPEAEVPPAMDAVLRIFKRLNGMSETGVDDTTTAQTSSLTCPVRLLVPSSQAINLIGKQGSSIKQIQESSGATIKVLTVDEFPDERFVDFQGESSKVAKALEAVVGHLRKFLVDHGVLPLFEKSLTKPAAQDRTMDSWADKPLMNTRQPHAVNNDYQLPLKRESSYLEREPHLDSQIPRPGFPSLHRQGPHSESFSSGIGRSAAALVTQVTQTMQIPLTYAEDIIGSRGANIAYIRRTSGAALTVQEGGGLPDEITVEIKGTSAQVQTAQQLIQDFMTGHKEPSRSSYEDPDPSMRSTYSHQNSGAYPSSSFPSSYGGYSSGYGGYGGGYGSGSGYRF